MRTGTRVRSGSTRLVLTLGLFAALGAPGTAAYVTETAPVSGTTLAAARVDLKVQGLDTLTYTSMNAVSMAPGGSTAGVLTVTNAGSVPLDYYVTSTATDPDGKGLAAALVVKVTGDASDSGAAPTRTCPGSALAGSATSFTTSFVGSESSPRTLAAGAVQRLCIQASLPDSAATNLQAATTSIGFTFTAATNPVSPWADTVTVGGVSLGTASILTPTLTCGARNQVQVAVNWPGSAGATGYRIHYGTGAATSSDLGPESRSFPFKAPASGTTYLQAYYGSTWVSESSNTLTYVADGHTSTCS